MCWNVLLLNLTERNPPGNQRYGKSDRPAALFVLEADNLQVGPTTQPIVKAEDVECRRIISEGEELAIVNGIGDFTANRIGGCPGLRTMQMTLGYRVNHSFNMNRSVIYPSCRSCRWPLGRGSWST